jgi:hypothetical protein
MFLFKNFKSIFSIFRNLAARRDLRIPSSRPAKTNQKVQKSVFCPDLVKCVFFAFQHQHSASHFGGNSASSSNVEMISVESVEPSLGYSLLQQPPVGPSPLLSDFGASPVHMNLQVRLSQLRWQLKKNGKWSTKSF